MNTIDLKQNLHKLIDTIENENFLSNLYEFISNRIKQNNGKLWENLSIEQKKELTNTFEESFSDENLIDNESVIEKYKKWL